MPRTFDHDDVRVWDQPARAACTFDANGALFSATSTAVRTGVDPEREALILLVVVTGLSQGVLDGQITAAEAFATIDYSLEHAVRN